MRGKAKQRVSLILVVTMVLGTVLTGNTVFATGESSDEQDRIKINISKDSEQTVEQNVTQTIHVTAQGQCSQSVLSECISKKRGRICGNRYRCSQSSDKRSAYR